MMVWLMDQAFFETSRPDGRGWNVVLEGLVDVYVANRPKDVCSVLDKLEAVARAGQWVGTAYRVRRECGPPSTPDYAIGERITVGTFRIAWRRHISFVLPQ